MKVVGLFSGIGGLELPFHERGIKAELLCDVWDASRSVLGAHFPGVKLEADIKDLTELPPEVNVVTAGFPCTDLSQAGRTAGIGGKESGLVSHVFRLLENKDIEWLVLENVRNMLVLDNGAAMAYLVSRLEELQFRWAYRLVDSRFTGVPQRRQRVLFVASRHHDPREVLFADESAEPGELQSVREDAFGFYWTEGLTGLGWAQDAVPPLKGGSTVGIPSPPAIWVPNAEAGRKFVVPCIEEAEELQGFTAGWTEPAQEATRNGPRWKLVGNAVTVGVADWLVSRLMTRGEVVINDSQWLGGRWPEAAYGHAGKVWSFDASQWPLMVPYQHLTDLVDVKRAAALSHRATAGFLERVTRSKLRFDADFIADLKKHVVAMDTPAETLQSSAPRRARREVA